MLGRRQEAIAVLDSTTRRYGTNRLWALFLATSRALVCGTTADAVSLASAAMRSSFRDPEGLLYVCFVLSRMHEPTLALEALRRAVDAGFACPSGLTCEPAMHALAGLPEFGRLRAIIEQRHRKALVAFRSAGGDGLLPH
jgi:hypothetical protein